jgi:hypothetical protein
LSASSSTVLAVPGLKPGSVHVELYDIKHTQLIQAHNNALTQICLNLDGTRLATASEKVSVSARATRNELNCRELLFESLTRRVEINCENFEEELIKLRSIPLHLMPIQHGLLYPVTRELFTSMD